MGALQVLTMGKQERCRFNVNGKPIGAQTRRRILADPDV